MPIRYLSLLLLCAVAKAQSDPTVIRSSTHLVVLNVVVKDKHGKPVADLKRDDFAVRDNGQGQKIAIFALEDSRQSATVGAAPIAPLTFTNRPPLSAGHVTVFLFDQLNTRLADQPFAKKEFVKYLQHMPADERVAIFVLGDSLSLLHDFSQDSAALIASVNRHGNRATPEADASAAPPPTSNSLTGDANTTAQWDSFLQSAAQVYTDYAETVRAKTTAEALETIAAHLQGIPGRKTLIWISGGFPIQLGLNVDPNIPQSNPAARQSHAAPGRGSGRGSSSSAPTSSSASATPSVPMTGLTFEDEVGRAIFALNEADIAVYPVDARGITTTAIYQADRVSAGSRSKQPKAVAPPDFNYETLQKLAQETGGRAFHNINDLNTAIQEAASDAQVSYALAFYPPADSLDDSYHKLEVSVQRQGVDLRYRPGYMAAKQSAMAATLTAAVASPVALAGIGFTAHLTPTEGGYQVSLNVDASNLTLEQKEGKWTGSLQFLVRVGNVEQLTTVPLNFTDAMFHQIQEKGLSLGARVKIPPGTKGFSVGFRDVPSGLVGTLHVPL
jgi:VWFA-related protein